MAEWKGGLVGGTLLTLQWRFSTTTANYKRFCTSVITEILRLLLVIITHFNSDRHLLWCFSCAVLTCLSPMSSLVQNPLLKENLLSVPTEDSSLAFHCLRGGRCTMAPWRIECGTSLRCGESTQMRWPLLIEFLKFLAIGNRPHPSRDSLPHIDCGKAGCRSKPACVGPAFCVVRPRHRYNLGLSPRELNALGILGDLPRALSGCLVPSFPGDRDEEFLGSFGKGWERSRLETLSCFVLFVRS